MKIILIIQALLFCIPGIATSGGHIERVSVNSSGAQSKNGGNHCSISSDGRYVAFESSGSDLVANDTNGKTDIFVHDRVTKMTTRVSIASGGGQSNGHSYNPSISGDGRFVAFQSLAMNLVSGDTNSTGDIFVHDRWGRVTTRVSINTSGTQGNSTSEDAFISLDGRFVTFESKATNLVENDKNIGYDVFVHDRLTRKTTRASVNSNGQEADNNSYRPSISSDGRLVTYQSIAKNLVPNDTNGTMDIFVRDRVAGKTSRVSVSSTRQQGDDSSLFPAISENGRFVAFHSRAGNLVPGDTNGKTDVFVHDIITARTTRESVDYLGRQADDSSTEAAISADGRYVTFVSTASLVQTSSGSTSQVYLRDRASGRIVRISESASGAYGRQTSYHPCIAGQGGKVAFDSYAPNLVPGDSNSRCDVFVHSAYPLFTVSGTPRPGARVSLKLESPEDPGKVYGVGASFTTTPGIRISGRVIPLNPDDLLILSTNNPWIFQNFNGVLDSTGKAVAAVNIPGTRVLSGLTFYVACLVLDPTAPGGLLRVSSAAKISIE